MNKNKNPAVASLLGIETKKKEEADEKKEKTPFSLFFFFFFETCYNKPCNNVWNAP